MRRCQRGLFLEALQKVGVTIRPPTQDDPYFRLSVFGQPERHETLFALPVDYDPEVGEAVISSCAVHLGLTLRQLKDAIRAVKLRRKES
ncbi:MAG: hypothetical protein HY814_12075 [Candidatus Riflebacteria bacterium]|nr:hypothetical protein [Candidatus Riflebacteria bacterium]